MNRSKVLLKYNQSRDALDLKAKAAAGAEGVSNPTGNTISTLTMTVGNDIITSASKPSTLQLEHTNDYYPSDSQSQSNEKETQKQKVREQTPIRAGILGRDANSQGVDNQNSTRDQKLSANGNKKYVFSGNALASPKFSAAPYSIGSTSSRLGGLSSTTSTTHRNFGGFTTGTNHNQQQQSQHAMNLSLSPESSKQKGSLQNLSQQMHSSKHTQQQSQQQQHRLFTSSNSKNNHKLNDLLVQSGGKTTPNSNALPYFGTPLMSNSQVGKYLFSESDVPSLTTTTIAKNQQQQATMNEFVSSSSLSALVRTNQSGSRAVGSEGRGSISGVKKMQSQSVQNQAASSSSERSMLNLMTPQTQRVLAKKQNGTLTNIQGFVSQKRIESTLFLEHPSICNFEEISENFKTSMSLLDKSEMKKFVFHDSSTQSAFSMTDSTIQKKQKQPTVIFRPNVATLEQQIVEGRTNWIGLQMNEFTYFCVRVKGKYSPMRIRINQEKQVEFKVLVSREFSMPSQFNCDFKLQGSVFTFESEQNAVYFNNQDFFYFAIFSGEDTLMRLHVSFGAHIENSAPRSYQNPKQSAIPVSHSNGGESGSNTSRGIQTSQGISMSTLQKKKERADLKTRLNELSNDQLRMQVQGIMERRRMRMGGGGLEPNLIKKNIQSTNADVVSQTARLKEELKSTKKAKAIQAFENRELLIESHIDNINRIKEKKEIQKQMNIMTRLSEIKTFQKKSFDFYWITSLIMVIAVQKLQKKLQSHKERQRLMRDMAFSLLRPFTRYKVRSRKIGGVNIHARGLLDAKFVMAGYAKIKKELVMPSAEKTIVSALNSNVQRFHAIQRVLDYVEKGKRIAKRLLQFHINVFNYKKLLFRVWDKYYNDIIAELLSVKLDAVSQKDPSLIKRYTQNVLLSFNHLDHKRSALDAHFKVLFKQYFENLVQVGLISNNTDPYKKVGTMVIDGKVTVPTSSQSIIITATNAHAQSQQQSMSVVSPQNESRDDIPSEEQVPVEKPPIVYPKLFVEPSRAELKEIIRNAAISVSLNYPELLKKVEFIKQ